MIIFGSKSFAFWTEIARLWVQCLHFSVNLQFLFLKSVLMLLLLMSKDQRSRIWPVLIVMRFSECWVILLFFFFFFGSVWLFPSSNELWRGRLLCGFFSFIFLHIIYIINPWALWIIIHSCNSCLIIVREIVLVILKEWPKFIPKSKRHNINNAEIILFSLFVTNSLNWSFKIKLFKLKLNNLECSSSIF